MSGAGNAGAGAPERMPARSGADAGWAPRLLGAVPQRWRDPTAKGANRPDRQDWCGFPGKSHSYVVG